MPPIPWRLKGDGRQMLRCKLKPEVGLDGFHWPSFFVFRRGNSSQPAAYGA